MQKRMIFVIVSLAVLFLSRANAAGPEPILLWPDGAPGAKGDGDADKPQLRVYPVKKDAKKKNTGAMVVVCPGGGYGVLATDHEGHQVARWFNDVGVNAVVLKYRVSPYRHPAPLQDVQRAIRYVRANAKTWGVSTSRIGVMGFSAGGHLASTAATHFDDGRADAKDRVERVGCRPDFAILGYPVISMTEPYGHRGSKRNLLGDRVDDEELAKSLSSEQQVTAQTPPTFLFHTSEDRGVPVANSLAFYAALRKANVPAELHVYQYGPHGVGLAPADPVVGSWRNRLFDWMKTSCLLSDVERSAVSGTIALDGKPLRWGMIAFHPADDRMPVAWGRISGGKFSIPAHRGAARGKNRVVVTSLGSVESKPTIEKAIEFPTSLVFRITGDKNEVDLQLSTPE